MGPSVSTLQLQLDRTLAQTVALTERLKQHPFRFRWLTQAAAAVDFLARGVYHVWRNRRYLTTIKLANIALVNLQYKLKREYVFGRPYNMKIESTNICNTKCQLCPTGLGLQGRPKGKMSLDRFKALIDSMKWHLVAVDLSMWGDPLIVPEIFDMIRHAHDRRVWTYISSNLHAFKPEKDHARKLVESGLDMLTCSLHGASQETYAIYQPGKDFTTAVEKVRNIIETRNRMGSATPVVQLNFVVTRHNEHERAAFAKLAEELGCKAVFSTASMNIRFLGQDKNLTPLGLAPDIQKKRVKDHLNAWLPSDRDYVLEPYRRIAESGEDVNDYNGHKLFDCSWPWRMSVINWDGAVSTCCGSFDPKEDMGNIFEQSFTKIWNGPKYRMARRSFRHKLTDEPGSDNPCTRCPGFML